MEPTKKQARPQRGALGNTYVTHGRDFTLQEMANLAQHAKLSPSAARQALRELVDSIPEEELKNFVAGQITVVT